MKKLIFILLIMSSCSILKDTDYYIQPELQSYVDQFYDEAYKRGKAPRRSNLTFRIQKDLLKNTGGLGTTHREVGGIFADDQVECLIDYDYFYSADQYCIKSTIFHELGHALLSRGHINTQSIMNSNVKCFYKNEAFEKVLIDELFTY